MSHASRPSLDFPSTRHRKREGRCYEIAGVALFKLPADTEWTLVHGVVDGPDGVRLGHAWLIHHGLIWDPVTAETYPAHQYLAAGNAEIRATYSQAEMCAEVSRDHSWGPWVDNPGVTRHQNSRIPSRPLPA